MRCRSCGGSDGWTVLDLGTQPACDYFPPADDGGPDPVYPLEMWLCRSCGLAQLVADPTLAEEPRGAEPLALVLQAADAVAEVGAAGLLPAGGRAAEYGSPHGGSWLDLLAGAGLAPVGEGEEADVVVDCFGMMHAADQAAALAERVERLAPGATLLLQYHSLATILRLGQWNALRHGHYAYYSTTALTSMLRACGAEALRAWTFDLYGGTVLLAARRAGAASRPIDGSVGRLLDEDRRVGVTDPARFATLQDDVTARSRRLHDWLAARADEGAIVLGYGAASRAVSYLNWAGVDRSVLAAVADASAAKQGRRMPGTDIPIVAPGDLVASRPDAVLLFLPDLIDEVRRALPAVETSGGRWVDVDTLSW